jgi:hypothetical protein
VTQYQWGPSTSITVHQNAQFKRRTNKSHKPLVHAGNLNVGVKGELAKQGIVAASREASSVPACALAMEIVRQTSEGKIFDLAKYIVSSTRYEYSIQYIVSYDTIHFLNKNFNTSFKTVCIVITKQFILSNNLQLF